MESYEREGESSMSIIEDRVLSFRRLSTLFGLEFVGDKPQIYDEAMAEETRKTVLGFLGRSLDADTQADRLSNIDKILPVLDAWDGYEIAFSNQSEDGLGRDTTPASIEGEIRSYGALLAKYYLE